MNAADATVADRETIADKLSGLGAAEQSFLHLLMEDQQRDESLVEGLNLHLDRAAREPFVNALKLERLGEWIGREAPARLQGRLMEAARSSHHAVHQAFRAGLSRSGGLANAYPKA